MLLGEEEMDVATEVRSVVECILADRPSGTSRPRPPIARGGRRADERRSQRSWPFSSRLPGAGALLRGELSPAEGGAVVRHLLTGCPRCLAVTRRFWSLAKRSRVLCILSKEALAAEPAAADSS